MFATLESVAMVSEVSRILRFDRRKLIRYQNIIRNGQLRQIVATKDEQMYLAASYQFRVQDNPDAGSPATSQLC